MRETKPNVLYYGFENEHLLVKPPRQTMQSLVYWRESCSSGIGTIYRYNIFDNAFTLV